LETGQIDTYIEPFVGGGAVFFHISQKYPELRQFILFDINQDLVNCYNVVRNNPTHLISELKLLETEYLKRDETQREEFYYHIRGDFNKYRSSAKLIFLNKTCYNGLYRVNRNNKFNVPFGRYKNPCICDEKNLHAVSKILKKTEIICGDFEESDKFINEKSFVYFDPPYRPISATASFTSYSKEDFDESKQIRLSNFCRKIDDKGAKFLLSNSDPQNENPNDNFFERYYRGFTIEKVKATRAINCKGYGRGPINELIIINYKIC